jgi:hypothetical protein
MTSIGSLVTNKLKRKQRRERVRSLSREERAEALITNHVIPLLLRKIVPDLISEQINEFMKPEREIKNPSHHKVSYMQNNSL